ncbi:hypothetical protein D3C87_2103720 [compost metagenome]
MVMTITGSTLGRTSVNSTATCPLPDNRAASTNSRLRIETVTPLILRAKKGILTMAMA